MSAWLGRSDIARWLAGVVLAGAAALVVASSGSASTPIVTAATRRAIDTTLDRFVVDAVERHDPAAAWALAGPGLRAGTSRADWAAGRLNVYPFQTRDHNFHGWTARYASPGRIGFDLLLQPPRGAKNGAIAVNVVVRRIQGRWLVDYWLPVATFAPAGSLPGIIGPADLGAPAERAAGIGLHPRLSAIWVVVPVTVLSLPALFLLGFALVTLGERRGKRADLPPLPGTHPRTR